MRIHRWRAVLLVGMLSTAAALVWVPASAHTRGRVSHQAERTATEILDALPVPEGAEIGDTGDRRRSYTIAQSADAVLSFYRGQLAAAGWAEVSVGKVPSNSSNDELDSDEDDGASGPETSGDGTVEGSGGSRNDTGSKRLTGPVRARWSTPDARLKLRIEEAAIGTPQSTGLSPRQSEFVLTVRPRG